MTNDNKFHFIGINGIGMSGLAKYLLEIGCFVSGSDLRVGKYSMKLKDKGAVLFEGHSADNLGKGYKVVASTAIKSENPELQRAKDIGLPIYHRSDVLKMLSEGAQQFQKQSFMGFAGTHGKTTMSGLAAYVLQQSGIGASYVVGGIVPTLETNAEFNKDGKFFVAELDESDGTITKYKPDVCIINNIEVDHVDFYKDGMKTLIETFSKFLSNLKPDAKILVNIDCPGVRELVKQNQRYKFITYGLDFANYTAELIEYKSFGSTFRLHKFGKDIGKVALSIPGKHNIYNALAVIAACLESGIDFDKIIEHFDGFTGMGRRFQLKANIQTIKVIDDYAHHPSEIKATLATAKQYAKFRTVAIVQPHRYSRLKALFEDFKTAFDDADKVFVLDTYAAGETPEDGFTSKDLAETMTNKSAEYVPGTINQAAFEIFSKLEPGDIVLTLGAGDITEMAEALIQAGKVQSR